MNFIFMPQHLCLLYNSLKISLKYREISYNLELVAYIKSAANVTTFLWHSTNKLRILEIQRDSKRRTHLGNTDVRN